jgi:hypothetical protein
MDYIYVMVNGDEWENMVIYLDKEEAIQMSKKYPTARIEIFAKKDNLNGYRPTYQYYINGDMC